jgi:hypothetical protein
MYPWLWIWAPQVHFPWSGGVAQRIEPNTNWFFDAIPAQAGNAKVEKQAFEVASYGRQLGLMTEVLIGLTENSPVLSDVAKSSLERLKSIHAEIDKLKAADGQLQVRQIEDALMNLQKTHKTEFARLKKRLTPLLVDQRA